MSAYDLKDNCHGGPRDPDHARSRAVRSSIQRCRFPFGSTGFGVDPSLLQDLSRRLERS